MWVNDVELAVILPVCVLFFGVAFLYSSVGHGGASGYLAILSFFSFAPREMATTALLLNIFVAGISLIAYARAGHFSARLTLPFLLGSIPFAFVGGMVQISSSIYTLLLAVALFSAAFRLLMQFERSSGIDKEKTPPLLIAVPCGAVIGFLSGVVGVGGGIFLSPLILLTGWADVKRTSAAAAFFIVMNSIAGILGRGIQGNFSLGTFFPFMIAAFIGGLFGSMWGAKKVSNLGLRRLLAVVLLVAAAKLIIVAVKS